MQKRVDPMKCEILTFVPSLLLKNLKMNSRNLFGIELQYHNGRDFLILSILGVCVPMRVKKVELEFGIPTDALRDCKIFLQDREPFLKLPKNFFMLIEMSSLFRTTVLERKKLSARLRLK